MENVCSRRKRKNRKHSKRKGNRKTSESSTTEERRTQNEPSTSKEIRKTFVNSSTEEIRTQNEREELPSTSSSGNASLENCVTPEEMKKISERVRVAELRDLIIHLDIDDPTMEGIEIDCNRSLLPFKEIVYRALIEWKQRNGRKATRRVLKDVLVAMKRNDIVHDLFPRNHQTTEERKTQNETELDVASTSNRNNLLGIRKTFVARTENKSNILPSTSSGNASIEGCVTQEEMVAISKMVDVGQHTELAIKLNLSDQTTQDIETTCNLRNLPFSEVVYKILKNWLQRNGKEATRYSLKSILLNINRMDIADKVFGNLPESEEIKQMQKQYKGIQGRIEEGQRERYQRIELPQVNWTNRDLPLEELYVNMELLTSSDAGDESKGQEIQLEEMFRKINGKEPVRILIEGGPGYGKTTLCAKLLSDWGREEGCMSSKFKMVFLFELRYFSENDSIESELKRECEAVGVDGDEGIRCIEAFEEETLLILDGFDEMSEECKRKFIPLFQKNVYRSMFVLVTSRRGLFRVEKKKGKKHVGLLQKKNDIENVVDVWGKRVLIKGVTTDKIETFMRKYLQNDYQELEGKINSITGGEMRKVFQCPLFLILLAMMLEERPLVKVNTKTALYKEFFNFVVRRNLIREKKLSDDEEVDIFNESCKGFIVELIDQFGRFAIECLCDNKLLFEENEILHYCQDEIVLKLGFLMKIPKMEGRQRENFYQPIHKSFLEFAAAFAIWNLFKRDEQEFKREMVRMTEKGLKPTEDSLFYVFLGGLMNSQASVLFQSLIRYNSWFNIENLCFTNILLEIQDVSSFFPSFEPILDSFVSSIYSISCLKGLTREYFLSDHHSLILKHASDRQLIKVLDWNSKFSINLSREFSFDCLQFNLIDEVFKIPSKEKITSIQCRNIIYIFTDDFFKIDQWNDFVSLFNSIQSEKVHFFFRYQSNKLHSFLLYLLHQELIEGRLKQKNIDRLRYEWNENDDPHSLSLLVDLVKKNRIKEGIYLEITTMFNINENVINLVKSETEALFNSIVQSKTIQEFVYINDDVDFTLDIEMNRIPIESQLKRLTLDGRFNILKPNENKTENCSLEELNINSYSVENDLKFIQFFKETKYLTCSIYWFNALFKFKWPGLKVMEELKINVIHDESLHLYINSVSQLTNLQVLSFNVDTILTLPSDYDRHLFVHFFSSLRLRICEFLFVYESDVIHVRNLEIFSFLTETLMEGMKKREEEIENNPTLGSNEGRKDCLQELVVYMDLSELRETSGVESIRSMLRNQHLKQCCFFYYEDYIIYNKLKSLFPSWDNFRIIRQVDGMNLNDSHRSQFYYRWFEFKNCLCIKYVK